MAFLSLAIRRSMPNKDGSFSIKIQVSSEGKNTFITTKYKINSIKEWRDGRVVGNPDAKFINGKLRSLLMEYDSILDEMPNGYYTANQVKAYLLAQINKCTDVKSYIENYIANLKSNNQLSYAKNMGYTLKELINCFGEDISLEEININTITRWEAYLSKQGNSCTTINIRMSHLKAILNAAVNDGTVEYKIFPFRNYRMPAKNIRDICIDKEELEQLRTATFTGVSAKRLSVARDLFMLSFYCAGINLTDIVDAEFTTDILTFVRKKTADKKQGEKKVSITIQPEAREIINRYIMPNGKLDFGYNYTDYTQFRSFVTKSLNRIGIQLNFEKKLMFYSARKTFCQFGYELGIPLYVLEYAIGQTIKDANNRPIFNYIKIMRKQADAAIRTIIDYSLTKEDDTTN